jgi:predicted transporter
MKMLFKRFGILFVIAGVIILAYSEFSRLENNSLLILSGGLIVGGLLLYIILNNILD